MLGPFGYCYEFDRVLKERKREREKRAQAKLRDTQCHTQRVALPILSGNSTSERDDFFSSFLAVDATNYFGKRASSSSGRPDSYLLAGRPAGWPCYAPVERVISPRLALFLSPHLFCIDGGIKQLHLSKRNREISQGRRSFLLLLLP